MVIYIENEKTINMSKTTNATIERFKKTNAPDIHYYYYIKVMDTIVEYKIMS